jgi:DNA-binding response OmpR family regulator
MVKILLVTAESAVLSSWQTAAGSRGYVLDIALSGAEALERAVSGHPDAIVIGLSAGDAVLLENELQGALRSFVPCIAVTPSDLTVPDAVLSRVAALLLPGRILIAEDDRQMSAILSQVLARSGFEVRTAYDGVETLREIRAFKPHLLVLDIMLPVIDGFHVCQTINDDHTLAVRPKVVIISGRGSDWDQNLGAACGAELYLVKPFTNACFLEKVREIMKGIPDQARRR